MFIIQGVSYKAWHRVKIKSTCKRKVLLVPISIAILCFSSFAHAQNSNSNVFSKKRKEHKIVTFLKFFPDTGLATFVADKLNKKITDPVSVKELASIHGDFDIGVQPISNLKGIGYLVGIDSFHCSKNDVTEIPAEIGKLTNLKYLDLCKAFELKKIPREIGNLKKLQIILLSLTKVESIPPEIGNLTELKTLWLGSNNIAEIPKEIGNLINLEDLDLSSNPHLTRVPNEICNLVSLKYLEIAHCKLVAIPDKIGRLKELQSLNLFGNNLKYLPKSIAQLDKLKKLTVFDNFHLNEGYQKYLPKLLRK